jgi:hypothetical protein
MMSEIMPLRLAWEETNSTPSTWPRSKEIRCAPLFVIGTGEDEDQRDIMHGQRVRRATHQDSEVGIFEQRAHAFP